MRYIIFDLQLNKEAFSGKIFSNKTQTIKQLISFFSVDCLSELSKIRKILWQTNEFGELVIKQVRK